jgi:hypothetical protein
MKPLFFLFLFLNQSSFGSELPFLTSSVDKVEEGFNAIEKFGRVEECSEDVPASTHFQSTNVQCSSILSVLDRDAKRDGFAGLLKSYYPACEKYLAYKPRHNVSPYNLTRTLSTKLYPYLDENLKELESSCVHGWGNNEKSKKMASSYFYVSDQIYQSALSAMNTLAYTNSIMGDSGASVLEDIKCDESFPPKFVNDCLDIQSNCKAKGGEQIVDETINAMTTTSKAREEVLKLRMSSNVKDSNNRISELEAAIAILESQYPWIKGKRPESAKSVKRDIIFNYIKAQFRDTRRAAHMQFKTARKGMRCLKGQESSDDCLENLKEALFLSPTFKESTPNYRNSREVEANQYLNFQNCAMEGLKERDKTEKVLEEAALGAGLTLMTFGTSGAASLAVNAGRIRLLTIAQGLKKTSDGINALVAVKSTAEAFKTCSSAGKLQTPSQELKDNISSCPVTNNAFAQRDLGLCVSKLLVAGISLNGLKPTAFVTRPLLRKLSEAEVRGVRELISTDLKNAISQQGTVVSLKQMAQENSIPLKSILIEANRAVKDKMNGIQIIAETPNGKKMLEHLKDLESELQKEIKSSKS